MLFLKDTKIRHELSELRQEIDSLKNLIQSSIGNDGVQTDIRQTFLRQQADTKDISLGTTISNNKEMLTTTKEDLSAIEVVNLVNDFKESLIKKFKSITNQELFVFSIIYSLEEQLGAVSYKNIAEKAGISESATRDHVRGLIKKGIPLSKEKLNNKVNFFKVPSELRSIVSLNSLIQLRTPQKQFLQRRDSTLELLNIINNQKVNLTKNG